MRCCKEIEKKKAGICGLIEKTGKCLGKERRGALVSQKDFPQRRGGAEKMPSKDSPSLRRLYREK